MFSGNFSDELVLLKMAADDVFENRFNTNKLPGVNPPFCNDSRIAEEGSTLETAIHVCILYHLGCGLDSSTSF